METLPFCFRLRVRVEGDCRQTVIPRLRGRVPSAQGHGGGAARSSLGAAVRFRGFAGRGAACSLPACPRRGRDPAAMAKVLLCHLPQTADVVLFLRLLLPLALCPVTSPSVGGGLRSPGHRGVVTGSDRRAEGLQVRTLREPRPTAADCQGWWGKSFLSRMARILRMVDVALPPSVFGLEVKLIPLFLQQKACPP